MKKYILYWLALGIIVFTGCQKELSFEGTNAPAEGSLQSDITGDCLPKTVNGIYEAAKALVASSNSIVIQVNVTKTGTFNITTDTVNGYYFKGTGTFTTLGATNVTLRGNGTPIIDGVNNFVVGFDSTFCDIQVTVVPAGAGGPAGFTIQSSGSPASCSGATAVGNYIIGSPLTSANQVTLSVNVTQIGTYNVTTSAVNGMTFSAVGTFTTTGVQPLVLTGTGTPTGTAGSVTVPVTAGSSTCSFTVTTTAGAAYTIDCPNAIVNGTYQAGVPLTSSNTIDLPITVTTAGPFNISVTVNGMTFSASGSVTLSTTSITLNGSGTPTASGTSNLVVGTCTIPIPVSAAPTIDWKFNIGSTLYQGSTTAGGVTYTSATPATILDYNGDNPAGDFFEVTMIDMLGGITANETYNTTSTTSNSGAFYFDDGAGTLSLTADPVTTTGSPVIIIKVLTHNTATKTVTGTFSGTAYDSVSGTVKTITNGTFTAVYP